MPTFVERRAFLWKIPGGLMHHLSKKAVVLGLTCGLSACASITGGTHQHLSVETRSANHAMVSADCTVTNSRGEQHVATPGVVVVHRDRGPVDIRCVKDGAAIGGQQYLAHMRPMFWGNFLIGGLVGFIVDLSDGAARHYPDVLQVETTFNGQPAFVSYAQPGSTTGESPARLAEGSMRVDRLASLDGRINQATFNAAQNVAASQQCGRDIHVVMADGQRALFNSRCPTTGPLQIECNAATCVPMRGLD
jgi:hypothetical protein